MGDLWDAYRQSLGSEKKQDVRRKVAPEGLSRINQDTRLLGECPSCKALNRITIDSTMTEPFFRYLELKDDDNQPICRDCFANTDGVLPEALSKKDFIQMKALKLLDKLQRNKE